MAVLELIKQKHVRSTSSRVDPWIFPAHTPPSFLFLTGCGRAWPPRVLCAREGGVTKWKGPGPQSLLGGGADGKHLFGVGQGSKPASCLEHAT